MTIIIVHEPGVELYYLLCLETELSGPRLIRAWKRRHWIEHCCRIWQHLLATGAWQLHNEDAYYGHLVLRLMGCLVLFYTSRVMCTGQLTREEMILSLKHYWRFVDSEVLGLKALPQGMDEKAACTHAKLRDRKSQTLEIALLAYWTDFSELHGHTCYPVCQCRMARFSP